MVVFKEVRKKGSGKISEKPVFWATAANVAIGAVKVPEGAVLCGGQIKVDIKLEYNGHCQCSGGSIEIDIHCDRCGNRGFDEFPRFADDMSKFVTRMIEEMPDEKYQEMLGKYVEAWKARHEAITGLMAKREKR